MISVGGGNVICTDGAGAGWIAVMSIPARARQIGRTYLGWTEDFLGYDVITGATSVTAASVHTVTTISPAPNTKEIDMRSSYLIKGAVNGTMGNLNGMLALIGPSLFVSIGSQSDFDGIARDLAEDPTAILNGYDPANPGVQRAEFVRLVSVFGIEPSYVGPGGRYYGHGHPLNQAAQAGL